MTASPHTREHPFLPARHPRCTRHHPRFLCLASHRPLSELRGRSSAPFGQAIVHPHPHPRDERRLYEHEHRGELGMSSSSCKKLCTANSKLTLFSAGTLPLIPSPSNFAPVFKSKGSISGACGAGCTNKEGEIRVSFVVANCCAHFFMRRIRNSLLSTSDPTGCFHSSSSSAYPNTVSRQVKVILKNNHVLFY